GWNEIESRAFGVAFPAIRDRLDLLEEQAVVLRRLFDGERVTFEGRHVQLVDALCLPRPLQPRLRLWIGGQGERRMLRLVAPHADGRDVPFPAPAGFVQRERGLHQWCERQRRGPPALPRALDGGLPGGADAAAVHRQEENLRLMFGPMTDFIRPGVLVGTPREVIDRIGAYAAAGAEWVILALRAPFDWEGLDLFVREVMPAFPA